jgi:hypothetical protein
MPIFMARHDMRDATNANVAEAHVKDLEVQKNFGVKYMTYWFERGAVPASASSMRPMRRPPSASTARRMASSRQK